MSDQPISPLVATLISASLADTFATGRALTDSLTEQTESQAAHIDAIRGGIHELLSGPYMPTPDAIRRALYPSPELVDHYRQMIRHGMVYGEQS